MKTKLTVFALGAFTISSVLAQQVDPPKSAVDIPGTPANTIMTKEYVETVGRLAYVWGWPLVNNFNRAERVKDLPEPGHLAGVLPVSPPGQISMLTDYIDEKERFVTCPNQDTVYGAHPWKGFGRSPFTTSITCSQPTR